jgi:hypothetical protein
VTVTTFSFTTGATVSSWTVPNHTGLVTITAIGGGGGTSVGHAVGGNGARLAGTCTLTPGTVLTIIEGGGGGDSWNEPGGARRGGAGGGATGWKGGNGGDGTGSWIIPNGWQAGGGGGGASAVDTPGGVLIVAGGGGGGGNSGYGSGDIGYAAGVGTLVASGHVGATGGTRGGGGGGGMPLADLAQAAAEAEVGLPRSTRLLVRLRLQRDPILRSHLPATQLRSRQLLDLELLQFLQKLQTIRSRFPIQ